MLTEKLNRKDNSIGLLFNDTTFYQNLSATTANAATQSGFESASANVMKRKISNRFANLKIF